MALALEPRLTNINRRKTKTTYFILIIFFSNAGGPWTHGSFTIDLRGEGEGDNSTDGQNSTNVTENIYKSQTLYMTLQTTLSNLEHFSEYSIEVCAMLPELN